MKNIVFDLGGVLFARDKSKCTPELLEFFSFLRAPRMPLFWEEYDRGTSTLEEVTATISGMTGRPVETCAAVLRLAVDLLKPEPRIYEILLERYGLTPSETLFIDDREMNIEAAAALGIHGFVFDHRDPDAACDALRRRLLQSDCI